MASQSAGLWLRPPGNSVQPQEGQLGLGTGVVAGLAAFSFAGTLAHPKVFKVGITLQNEDGGSYRAQPAGSMHEAVLPQDGELTSACWHPSPACAVCSHSHKLGITPWGCLGKAGWPHRSRHLLGS